MNKIMMLTIALAYYTYFQLYSCRLCNQL